MILGVFLLNVTSPSVVLVHTSACLFCVVLPGIVRRGGHGVILGIEFLSCWISLCSTYTLHIQYILYISFTVKEDPEKVLCVALIMTLLRCCKYFLLNCVRYRYNS